VTVFVAVMVQVPFDKVYVIVAVPADTPVTTPDEDPTVATDVAELDHVPPVVVPDHVAVPPTQSGVVPLMVWFW